MHQTVLRALILLALVCWMVNGKPKNLIARNVNDKRFSVREFMGLVDRLVAKRSGCVASCTDLNGNKYSCNIYGVGSDGSGTGDNPGCYESSYTYFGCPPHTQFATGPKSRPSATVIVTKTRGEAYRFDDDADSEDDVGFQRRDDFFETCKNVLLFGSGLTITAQCKDKDGKYQQTILDISNNIINQNGQLETSCSTERRRRALDSWSSLVADDQDLELQRREDDTILASCGGVRLIPYNMNLVASCRDENGCWNPTMLDLNNYITNVDGQLRTDCKKEHGLLGRRQEVVQP